jgi:hypothetical protein
MTNFSVCRFVCAASQPLSLLRRRFAIRISGIVNCGSEIRENSMRNALFSPCFVLLCGLGVNALGQSQAQQQSAPKVKVGSSLTAKASSPVASSTAKNQTKKNSIGEGKTTVKASEPSSFWTEELDVDDDGTVETSDFMYDAQRGVLYTYREDDFSCPNGKPESGSILEALYAKGNKAGKAQGSGWYAVNLNAGQCNAQRSGTFGCRFDASGNATECGAIAINYSTGEVDIAAIQ